MKRGVWIEEQRVLHMDGCWGRWFPHQMLTLGKSKSTAELFLSSNAERSQYRVVRYVPELTRKPRKRRKR